MNQTKLLTLFSAVMMIAVILAAGTAGAAELTLGETVQVWHQDTGGTFNVSVYPGKASYLGNDGVTTGTFGDGTVLDYRFFTTDNTSGSDAMSSYADGGAGVVLPVTSPDPSTVDSGSENWPDVWTASDPGASFSNPADFTDRTLARAQNISGVINISNVRSGEIYVIHGTYVNSHTITMTMSGAGLEDIVATYSMPNGPSKNIAWITKFDFVGGDGYDTITYTYTNTDADASRARFIGVIVDGITNSEPEILYPKNGEIVPPGDVTLLWENIDDPNGITIDVAWGTDPNRYTGAYTEVVTGGSETVTSATITPPGPGVYYWYIDTHIGGVDPCTIEGTVYMFTNDGPVESVDVGPDMVTWTGEPVLLAPTIVDDAGSALTYDWAISTPNGLSVVVVPGTDVEAPTVTLTMVPYDNPNLINGSFEDPQVDGQIPGWTGVSGYVPGGGGYDNAPDGANWGYVQPGRYASQTLYELVQEGATYTLSAVVGWDSRWGHTDSTYIVQLLAGSGDDAVVLAEDSAFMNDPAIFYNASVTYTIDPVADADLIGKHLQVRLVCDEASDINAFFDKVVLTSDTPFTNTPMLPAELTLTVQDVTNPAVSDTMTIEVYESPCMAAREGRLADLDVDYDKNCVVNDDDLAIHAAAWLNDTSATEAAVNPVQSTGGIIINGDFQTIVKPGTTMPAYVNDGNYWNIDSQSMRGGGIATYEDGTTGTGIETPGWVVADGSKTNADCMQGGGWGGPEGSGDIALLCFGSWGGPTYVETAAPLSIPTRGPNVEYELSCDVYNGGGPVILELLVDGVVITPDTESSPTLAAQTWVKFTRTYASIPEGNVTVMVGTRDDAGTGWTGNRVSIDNVELNYEITDPLAPDVDAGVDMITWLGQPVTMAPIVEPNALVVPTPTLVYNWTVEDANELLTVDIDDPTSATPTVTITGILDAPVKPVTLKLSVNNEGDVTIVPDTVTIDVYPNGCEVVKIIDPTVIEDTDHNIDCITNLADFAVIAADWLEDYALTEAAPKIVEE